VYVRPKVAGPYTSRSYEHWVALFLLLSPKKGSTGAVVKLLLVTMWWKQPLAEMQGKAMYIRPKVGGRTLP
jgi:hypothetical protein